jgi:diacylglycerol kinase
MRLHVLAAAGVVAAGCVFALAAWEWVAVVVCIGLVIAAECFNTALERLADRVSREPDPLIRQAKDCGSAAVLVLAIMALAVGGIVFVPKIWVAAGL